MHVYMQSGQLHISGSGTGVDGGGSTSHSCLSMCCSSSWAFAQFNPHRSQVVPTGVGVGVKRFGVGVVFMDSTALTSILVALALTRLLRFGAAAGVGAAGVGVAEVAAVVPSAVSVPELARLFRLGAVPPVVGVGVAGVAAVLLTRPALVVWAVSGLGNVALSAAAG